MNYTYNAQYASEVLDKIPYGYIDKKVCGVGLTSVALEKGGNTVVAVPTLYLIHNKVQQYPNTRYNKEVFGVTGDVTVDDINNYVERCSTFKIMVTYDSLWKVEHLLTDCHLIIDESNRLLSFAGLKASSKKDSISEDIINRLFKITEKYKDSVSFISATPIPLDYMPYWIRTIPYIEMNWKGTVKAQPILLQRTYPYKSLIEEILEPLKIGTVEIGDSKFSKVIIFLNSVSSILNCISKAKIQSKDVRLILADSAINDVRIKGYKRLEKNNELSKYTFVTSSGFDGIDLVDNDAMSIVVSNVDKQYHMIDMTTDLKQAISRQRDKTNPNYGKFIYIYNQTVFDKDKDELLLDLDKFKISIEEACYLYDVAKRDSKLSGFELLTKNNTDFIHYTNYDRYNDCYILNEHLFNADRYFIIELREQYKKGFDIKLDYIEESTVIDSPIVVKDMTYQELVKLALIGIDITKYEQLPYYSIVSDCMRLFGTAFTNYTYACKMVKEGSDIDRIKAALQGKFKIGKSYTVDEVKRILVKTYKILRVSRTPKASDLQEFVKCRISTKNGIRLYIPID